MVFLRVVVFRNPGAIAETKRSGSHPRSRAQFVQVLLRPWRHTRAQRPRVFCEDIRIEYVIRCSSHCGRGVKRDPPFPGRTVPPTARTSVQ